MKNTGTYRERQKEKTRQHIQAVARKLIAERGYEKTTMRLLAKEAGVGLGTIGLHFQDKRSLLLASFHDEIGGVVMEAIQSVPRQGPFRDQIKHILTHMYTYYAADTGYLRIMVKEALFARGEWGQIFEKQIAESTGVIAGMLGQAQDRSEIRPDVDCAQFSKVFWPLYLHGLTDGFKRDAFIAEDQVSMIMGICDAILDGILE